ncbi:hypothetical protein [Hymenobacter ruricola]|uniref:PH domain-containing protein n=1 Tax=Hymenobacter ruricola TaxID=2791023 RepID=A0ABS0IB86_9BACT|nr:hypothetical protein [Hymenobacter ruricola]MBF9224179.1 hypothetical protein [Hymenobacter ruricola]
MKEVRYVRWKAMMQVMVGAAIATGGLLIIASSKQALPGVLFLIFGTIMALVNRLKLKEKDVLLRLTPEQIWTKEFGWQPWGSLLVKLENSRQGYSLEIRRPTDFTPRFHEYVSALTISEHELQDWVKRFAAATD